MQPIISPPWTMQASLLFKCLVRRITRTSDGSSKSLHLLRVFIQIIVLVPAVRCLRFRSLCGRHSRLISSLSSSSAWLLYAIFWKLKTSLVTVHVSLIYLAVTLDPSTFVILSGVGMNVGVCLLALVCFTITLSPTRIQSISHAFVSFVSYSVDNIDGRCHEQFMLSSIGADNGTVWRGTEFLGCFSR